MAALADAARMALQHKAMSFHHPIYALGVDGRASRAARLPPQKRPDPAVAIGRLSADDRLDVAHEIIVRLGGSPNSLKGLGESRLAAGRDVRTGNAERLANGLHRVSPLGAESARNRCFFWPPAMSNASLRISASIVFLPSKRWASRSWICRAR